MRAAHMGTSTERLGMMPMIDVVFLLLIFFVLVIVPRDPLVGLGVSRHTAPEEKPMPTILRIDVFSSGFRINQRWVNASGLEDMLDKIGRISSRLPVLVACQNESEHSRLILALDLCTKAGFERISVASL